MIHVHVSLLFFCFCFSLFLLLSKILCFSLFLLLNKIKSSVITRLTMCHVLCVIWKGNGCEILLTNVNIIRLQCAILYIYQDFFISDFFHHTFFCISIKQAWGDFMVLWFVYTCFFPYISLWNELFYCFLFLVYISHLFDSKNNLSLLTLDWLCSNTFYSTTMDARKKDPCISSQNLIGSNMFSSWELFALIVQENNFMLLSYFK